MISKPPALLVSWPQRLRADQKVKRASCESRAPHIAVLLTIPYHKGGQIPFRGVFCCSHGIGVSHDNLPPASLVGWISLR